MKRRIAFALLVVAALLMLNFGPAQAADYPFSPGDSEVSGALDYLRDQQGGDGNIGGLAVSAWTVMAIAAAGESPHEWKNAPGNPSIVDYLSDNSDQLDWDKATDLERHILAICAAGEDPTDFGGEDYVTALKGLYDGRQIGYDDTVNDDYWGVLALIAAGESPGSDIIQDAVDFIKSVQNEDGGWNWEVYGLSDVDDTAAAIMALVAAGVDTTDFSIQMGLLFMDIFQNPDGGFPSGYESASNAASDAWAIGALEACGEDIGANWSADGGTPVDNLLSLQHGDGYFEKTAGQTAEPEFMTAYAIPALLGDPYPVTPATAPPPVGEADLTISDIDVPGTIYLDSAVTVTANVENTGGEDIAGSFQVRLYADTDTVDTVTVSGLDAGASKDVDFDWTPDAVGTCILEVVADVNDDIGEESEVNNSDTLNVSVDEQSEEADLAVTDIDAESTMYVDEETTVTVSVENVGGEDVTASFEVILYADADTIGIVMVSGLDAGDSTDVDFEWTPDAAGSYTLEAVADIDGDIDEGSEANNDDTLDVTVEEQSEEADLTVTDIDLPAELVAGTEAVITATVKNSGGENIDDDFEVGLVVDGDGVDTESLSGLDAGESTEVDLEWIPDAAGEYTLEVNVDTGDVIDEGSESNNYDSAEATVTTAGEPPTGGADLVVEDMAAPASLEAGMEAAVTATVTNTGGEAVSDFFRVRLYAGGEHVNTLLVEGLPAGGSTALQFAWEPAGGGSHTLEVVADLDDAVDEDSEDNNSASLEVTVSGGPGSDGETPPAEGLDASAGISATLEPGGIRFSGLAPGETSESYTVTVTNSGESAITVTAGVESDSDGFYAAALKLNGQPWQEFSAVVPAGGSLAVEVHLEIPASYDGEGAEDGYLAFWTELAP